MLDTLRRWVAILIVRIQSAWVAGSLTVAGMTAIILWMRHRFAGHGWEGIDGWSLHIGQWEWAHHRPLTFNPASWNGFAVHRAWVNVEWGWQAILAGVGDRPALWGFFAICIFGLLATAWWAWRPLVATRGQPWSAWAGTFGILLVTQKAIWTFRPMLWSFSLWAILIGVTVRMHRDARWAWVIIPLTVLWANLHGDFLLIFAWLAFEAGWALIGRWQPGWLDAPRPRGFGWTLLGVSAGSLGSIVAFTPNHLATLTYSLWLSNQAWIHLYVLEWHPLSFSNVWLSGLGILVGIAVVLRVLAQPWRRDQLQWFVWSCVIWSVSLVHQRFLPYIGVPLAGLWWSSGAPREAPESRLKRVLPLAFMVSLSLGVWAWGHPSWGRYQQMLQDYRPVAQWIRRHPRPGLIYTQTDTGLLEQLGITHLYMDGRYGLFLRTVPVRSWLVVAWDFPSEWHADQVLVSLHRFMRPAQGWTNQAQAQQALNGLIATGMTRWIAIAPLRPAQGRALQSAHWTAVSLPHGIVLWQAPPKAPALR